MTITPLFNRNSNLGILSHWAAVLLLIIVSKGDMSNPYILLGFSVIFASVVSLEILCKPKRIFDSDLEIWNMHFKEALHPGFISFLEGHDFCSSYREYQIKPLIDILLVSSTIDFLDKDLQKEFVKLKKKIDPFYNEVAHWHFPVSTTGVAKFSDAIIDNQERRNEIGDKITKLARDCAREFKSFKREILKRIENKKC